MGWAYCGVNSDTGEEMGYSIEGVCHHPDCEEKIDHGLGYVCGGMHENGETCGHYFCGNHLVHGELNGRTVQMCEECYDLYSDDGEKRDE